MAASCLYPRLGDDYPWLPAGVNAAFTLSP
nr:MAG TPA: hypothetical protein [Caudoviricetes sp.]